MTRFVLSVATFLILPLAAVAGDRGVSLTQGHFSYSHSTTTGSRGGSVSGSSTWLCVGNHCEHRELPKVITVQCSGTPENGACSGAWSGQRPDLIREVYPDGTVIERTFR